MRTAVSGAAKRKLQVELENGSGCGPAGQLSGKMFGASYQRQNPDRLL
jgi:hypothetical protein